MARTDKAGASAVESVTPYENASAKAEQVEQMFDSIAPAYDFMNTAMSFGLHRRWRKKALDDATRAFNPASTLRILDIATGTGDVAFDLHARFPKASVTGIDLSEGMLDVARRKLEALPREEQDLISFAQGDSLRLSMPDDGFDLVTVAYGVRNFERLEEGLREMCRVMRPGGRLCVIELSEPSSTLVRKAYRLYSRTLIPAVGKLVSGDSRAYSYLPESIAAAPQRNDMAILMKRAGFCDIRWKSLTMGAVTFYLARKPISPTLK